MEVQETIRRVREINQLTQEEMAEKLNISVNGYSKIERGITKLSLEKLEQIANIFNINVSELYAAKEKGFLYLFSDNYGTNYYNSSEKFLGENERLKLQLKHLEELLKSKEEIINKLNDENSALKEIVALLKQK